MVEKNQTEKTPIVKGDRICLRCKGLCSSGSYRLKVSDTLRFRGGMRSHYFCSLTCVKLYFENKYNLDEMQKYYNEQEYSEYLNNFVQDNILSKSYERVDVEQVY